MANRRMFAKAVIDSDAFMEMPATAQVLYFHMSMRADDDGFVGSPKRIMRMIGSGEDDMKTLFEKGFVIPFDSGVVVITHWKMNNIIRGDRYKATVYDTEKSLLQTSENGVYSALATVGIPNGNQTTTKCHTNGKPRLGKVRLGKDIDIHLSSDDDKSARMDYQKIVDSFNQICQSLPKVKTINDKRKKAIRSADRALSEQGGFRALFEKVERSDFLTGRIGNWNGCGFDWILAPSNMAKIMEGNYDNRGTEKQHGYTDPEQYTDIGWRE